MRLAWMAIVLLVPGVASAQAWYAAHASVYAGDTAVGELFGARIRPSSWASDTRPRVAYADDTISMEVEVSLEDAETYVSLGVGRDAPVRTTTPFRIEMRALSWAPLLGRAPGGLRVALPPGMPATTGVLADGATPAPASADAPSDAFSHPGPPDRFDPACGRLVVRARPDPAATAWEVDGDRAALALGVERGRFTRARVFVDGFVVHGWLDGAPPSCDGTIHMGGFGNACGDGWGEGIVVTLPAGTALYATRAARRPFAHLRRDTVGVEPLRGPVGMGCTAAGCERSPPEPRGPASWILHGHAGEASWLLTAWVRTPAEQLARPADGASGFGACWSPPTDWPRP
ncbi:MAG: hypothetical protein R3B82_25750 [Sandaracinaceae bacterium]